MSDPPLDIEPALVQRLVADQFPQWSGLPVRRVAAETVLRDLTLAEALP